MRLVLKLVAFCGSAIAAGLNHEFAGHMARAAIEGALYGMFRMFWDGGH